MLNKSVFVVGLMALLLISSVFAQGTTRISFPHTESFPYTGEKTGLLHDVAWNLTLTFDLVFPVDIATETNVTAPYPNDYVAVNATATAPENEAYYKITATGTLNISGAQINRDLVVENVTEIHFTTPIGEEHVDFPPIEISDNPELYAVILEPSITFYTSVIAETSTQECSVVSGDILQWLSDGETATTIIQISSGAEEGDMAKLNLIDFTYYLGASIHVTIKLRILAQEIELDDWLFTIPGRTVSASDTVTIPLSWTVIPEFTIITLMITLILATSTILILKRKR